MPVAEFPTLKVIAEERSERRVTVCVDEVVVVGAVGDEFSPQVTVATVAMTTVMKRPRLDFTFRAPPTTMLTKTAILPLAGRRFNAGVDTDFWIPRHN